MRNFNTKVDDDPTSAGEVVAAEYNSLFGEIKNMVKSFFTLDEADSKQLVRASDAFSKANVYSDGGAVNTLQLTRLASIGAVETLFDGMVVMFKPANVNTGATTIKLNALAAKTLFFAGADIAAGFLRVGVVYSATYDLANDRFDCQVVSFGNLGDDVLFKNNGNIIDLDGNVLGSIAGKNKNVLINGNFNIWQRGVTFTGGYTADRWVATGIASADKNESGSPTGSNYNMLINRSAAGAATIAQRIEGDNAVVLQNAQAALSFYYSFVSGDVSSIDVSLSYANVKDDFSAVTLIENINIANPAAGTKLEAIFSVLPATVSNGLLLNITFNTVAGCQVRLAQVQLEKGSNVTEFEYMDVSRELAMCQRYYEIVTGNFGRHSSSGTSNRWITWHYKVVKRVVPSIVWVSMPTYPTNVSSVGVESVAAYTSSAPNASYTMGTSADAEL